MDDVTGPQLVERIEPFAVTVMRLSEFDPEEIVTLHGHGSMTLRTAVERVLAKDLCGLESTIFRKGKPSILGRAGIEKLAAEWAVTGK